MERKEAIEVVKKNWPDSSFTMLREALETLIPELKESEDERIRKAIIKCLKWLRDEARWTDVYGSSFDSIFSWLEKQGEQKPAFEMKTPEESLGVDSDTYNKIVDECIYGEQKPTWSEEDEKMFNSALWHVKNSCGNSGKNSGEFEVYNWLKSLKDRYTWKPSERQKEALLWCVVHLGGADKQTLGELLEALNKL